MPQFWLRQYFNGTAWHQDGLAEIDQDGIITSLEHVPEPSPSTDLTMIADPVIPGLVDLQVNGGGGILLNDGCDPQALKQICDAHAAHGTTSLAATIITDHAAHWRTLLQQFSTQIATMPRNIVALHLEGPFISPCRPGTHRFDAIRIPDQDDWPLLEMLARQIPVMMTIAPECLPIDDIRRLRDLGIILFAGHSECPPDLFTTLRTRNLLTGVTHLYNAMPFGTARNPGLAACALADPECAFGLIGDGIHVGDVFLRLGLYGENAWNRCFLVSDAMPPAGQAIHRSFMLYGQTVQVENSRCINQDGHLAGVAIPLDACIAYMVAAGFDPDRLWRMATYNPATILGNTEIGRIAVGAYADFCISDPSGQIIETWQAGIRTTRPRPPAS